MPQDCPRCNRPNGDAAPRCLYCGQALEPQAAAPAEAAATEAWPDSYTAVLTQDASTLTPSSFHDATGLPVGLLDLGTPLVLETFVDLEAAMAMHRGLAEAGLEGTVVADGRLGEPGPTLHARRGEWTGRNLTLAASDGHRTTLTLQDLAVIVRATVADPDTADESSKLRARSISGKYVPTTAGGASKMTVMDLYPRTGRPVRIVAERFDYSLLGAERQSLAIPNFEILVERIRELAPDARLDASFSKLDRGRDARLSEARRLDIHGRRLLVALLQTT